MGDDSSQNGSDSPLEREFLREQLFGFKVHLKAFHVVPQRKAPHMRRDLNHHHYLSITS